MIILGIETSCDETALALIETRGAEYRIINSLVHSQADLHSAYGGVFPSLAKREHSKNLVPLLKKLFDGLDPNSLVGSNSNVRVVNGTKLTVSNAKFNEIINSYEKELAGQNSDLLESILHSNSQAKTPDVENFLQNIPAIDLIAVTEGPGLEPALWVGINFALILSKLWDIPVMPINHMEGHIVGSLIDTDKAFGTWQRLKELPLPSIALLISGGHTELVKIESGKYTIIGQTKDDAVGEAFDKVARLLELPYPGGPHISKLAFEAREKNIKAATKLPRPMINSGDLDFSFSGLKTAVLYNVRKEIERLAPSEPNNVGTLTYEYKAGLAREFEDSVTDVLVSKLKSAIEKTEAKSIIIGGGVSANHNLCEAFKIVAAKYNIPLLLPSRHITGDNALMIALAGAINNCIEKLTSGAKIGAKGSRLHADGTKRLG
jgi:N6-L-threonylcarbamoyladenine synthase